MPNLEALREWVADLRSGKFRQTTGRLFDGTGHCCLGVACESHKRVTGAGEWQYVEGGVWEYAGVEDVLPPPVAKWLGLNENPTLESEAGNDCLPPAASELNDSRRWTFTEITDALCRNYGLDLSEAPTVPHQTED